MKKSYHSTVVPMTVAKTTRRRSVCERMLPVGVKASGGTWALGFWQAHCGFSFV